eukprot:CAMPEP_0206608176 /NCGR_PEP_ID=MMETSP0325_2-20121206/52782_1 /ASSEMBLY_ACC=CAM_ASM_000347 /TAXON_ID=2866 /ORGANISM="Crypthecodinium cohnii, Strain Seligo" /LENGTH=124 /DNA_ID=CAMNT_0054125715 /DNA_START=184 /DNA_END=561 /DNA_ORIENTATION=-
MASCSVVVVAAGIDPLPFIFLSLISLQYDVLRDYARCTTCGEVNQKTDEYIDTVDDVFELHIDALGAVEKAIHVETFGLSLEPQTTIAKFLDIDLPRPIVIEQFEQHLRIGSIDFEGLHVLLQL